MKNGQWGNVLRTIRRIVAHSPKLLVNAAEAPRVRKIFHMYLRLGGLIPAVQELSQRGWTLKRWTTRKGVVYGGRPFTKTNLYQLLTNVVYVGQVRYQGIIYPGEHQAIVPPALFQQVQAQLRRNRRAATVRQLPPAVLRGLLR